MERLVEKALHRGIHQSMSLWLATLTTLTTLRHADVTQILLPPHLMQSQFYASNLLAKAAQNGGVPVSGEMGVPNSGPGGPNGGPVNGIIGNQVIGPNGVIGNQGIGTNGGHLSNQVGGPNGFGGGGQFCNSLPSASVVSSKSMPSDSQDDVNATATSNSSGMIEGQNAELQAPPGKFE